MLPHVMGSYVEDVDLLSLALDDPQDLGVAE